MQIVDAAREAASLLGYSDNTVRWLRKQFFNKVELDEWRGKYERVTVYLMKWLVCVWFVKIYE